MPLVDTERGQIWAAIHRRKHDAPSAIFIHGAGGSHLSFPAGLRQLPSIQPILIDLPGHGASAGAGRRSIGEYALDVLALIDALEIESTVAVGHSMGGAIAQQLALEHGERVRALVLIASGARMTVNPALVTGIIADADKWIHNLARWMWSTNAPADMVQRTAEIMRATRPSVIQGDLMACDEVDLVDRLPLIAAPTLILAGGTDKMTPVQLSEEMAPGIASADLEIVSNAGHMLQLEQQEVVVEIIERWISGLPH